MYQYSFPWAGNFGVSTDEAVNFLNQIQNAHLEQLTNTHIAELEAEINKLEQELQHLLLSIKKVEISIEALACIIKAKRNDLLVSEALLKRPLSFATRRRDWIGILSVTTSMNVLSKFY